MRNNRIIISILILQLLTGCSRVTHNTDLENSIQTIVKDKNKSQVNIDSLANFEWDKGYLFPPYTAEESMEKKMGVNFKDRSNINSRDDIYLLVFLNNEKVVQYVEMYRNQSDFSIEKEYITPSKALIKIKRN
ncbi:hypothetical protein [Fictibacillus phosphorivorans]|uniref:hypothetical protein n=1 Tax=Fictibacillus phosphorivorans TaxID=1221500 RepID=UPI001292CFEC|nr:hypothetical protein [Fictibacillus phosphorivorans]MQR94168.1 hypothetical protein [Fictibacillus phosphorivorans]